MKLTQDEVRQLFEDFLSDVGMWCEFSDWLEEKGYKQSELGFTEE